MRSDVSDVRRYKAHSHQPPCERSCERERSRSRYKDVPVTKIKFGSAGLIYQKSTVPPAKQAAEPRAPLQRNHKRQVSDDSDSESSTPRRMARIATEKALEEASLAAPKAEEGLKLVAKGGQDDVIRNIVVGSYHAHGENHGRKVWRRDAMAGENEVLIYYWDDRDGSSLAGWWIAPTIGGDEVWAFNKDAGDTDALPPEEDWCMPHDGPVDKSFTMSRVGATASALPASNGMPSSSKGKGTGTKKAVPTDTAASNLEAAASKASDDESDGDNEESHAESGAASEAAPLPRKQPRGPPGSTARGKSDPRAKVSDRKDEDAAGHPRAPQARAKRADKDESDESIVELARSSGKRNKTGEKQEVEEIDASEDKEEDRQAEDSEEEDEAEESQAGSSTSGSEESGTDLQGALKAALSTKEDDKPPKGVQEKIHAMKQSVEDEISQMEELQRHISERKKLEQELQAKAMANGDSNPTADKQRGGTPTFASAVQQQKEKLLARVANMGKKR